MSYGEVIERLDIIIKLLAINNLDKKNTQKDNIIQLHILGITPKQIMNIVGTTRNTVDVTLSNARKDGLI
ncbi:MAG: hypothetical protein ACTSQY_07525 [Candidatus Odinarchaeia archaeon]